MITSPTLRLDPDGVLSALGLTLGEELGGTWVVERAFPHHEGGVLVSLRKGDSRVTAGLQVRARHEGAPAWRRTAHLDVITQIPAHEDEAALLALLEGSVDRLEASDDPRRPVEIPEPPAPVPPPRRLELPAELRTEALHPFDFGRVFVLDLASDCGHRCSFCSTRAKMSPVLGLPEGERERLVAGLERAAEAGYRVLRLSGLDPLTHPDVVPLVEVARDLGFEHVHIYTAGPPLADSALRSALLAAMPEGFTLHVPLYGPTAEVHEGVTDVPGSFDAVFDALDALLAEGHGENLTLLTVVTRSNVAHLPALRELFSRWHAPVQVFLPFPSTRDPLDAFFDVALPHRAMIGPMMAASPPLGVSELLPCVRFRYERDHDVPALSEGGLSPMTAPLGTLFEHGDYLRISDGPRGNTFTIPVVACPHAGGPGRTPACALAGLCPRSVYSSYAEAFGLDELQPVTGEGLEAVLGTAGAHKLLAAAAD